MKYKGNNTKDKEGRGEGGGKSGGAPCARAEIPYSPWMTCTSADIHYSSETTLHDIKQMDMLEGTAAYYTRQGLYQSRFSCQQLQPMKRTQLEQRKSEDERAAERSCYILSSFHSQSSCAPQESGVKD